MAVARWPRMVRIFPLYEEYALQTDRQIPVVLLTAQEPSTPAQP